MTRWTGRSGRTYALLVDEAARDGGMASVRRVRAEGPPNATSGAPEGALLALKLARADEPLAREALAREAEIFETLTRAPGSPPCPRLHDVVGMPAEGLVMEWCPTDLERWWEQAWLAPHAFADLCGALADTCRRVREYAVVSELVRGQRVIHADIKPRNVLRAEDGRWLLTDFGAAKARPVDDEAWAATRMILGTENFIAPEALFNARKPVPAAMDTWAVACSFFALLRMRALLAEGGRMPMNGTHAPHFRSQRVALVTDLQQRKPGLFVDRALDPAAFVSPDRMPDKDRIAVRAALRGVFGLARPQHEEALAADVLVLLDRALRVDPAARFTDPLDLTHELEELAQRYRELAADVPSDDDRTMVLGVRGASADPVVPDPTPTSTPDERREDEMPMQTWTAPGWLKGALVALAVAQAVSIGLSGAALWFVLQRGAVPAASTPVTVASPPVASGSSGSPQPDPAPAPISPPAAEPVDEPAVDASVASGVVSAAEEPAQAAPDASTERTPARRNAPPVAATNPADSTAGMVLVTGAQAYLVGPAGRQPVGSVAPGTYELFAQARPDGEFQSLGAITVGSGARVVWKCGLGTCRPLQ